MTNDKALLAFWTVTERNEGIPPTAREFQAAAGLSSTSVATFWLGKLESAAYIYTPAALKGDHGSRTRKLARGGIARLRELENEAVA